MDPIESEFDFASIINVDIDQIIKNEPVDFDDEPQPRVDSQSKVAKRPKLTINEYLAKNYDSIQALPVIRKESTASVASDIPKSPVPSFDHYDMPSTSQATQLSRRDPRVKRRLESDLQVPAYESFHPLSTSTQAQKRKAFLNGQLSADDVINASSRISSAQQSNVLRNAQQGVLNACNQLSTTPMMFHSNVPSGQLYAGCYDQYRSPVIASNHNALFVSQATSANIESALIGQRYRNIPQNLQSTGQRLGIDLDGVSQLMNTPRVERRRETVDILFNSDKRSCGVQTEEQKKKFDHKETQTTKNTEGFDLFIPDIRALTQEQRDALTVFKEAMNIRDDSSTEGILERIQHRRAREYFNDHFTGNRLNERRDSDSFSSASSNPYAPSSAPRSKYASSAIPK